MDTCYPFVVNQFIPKHVYGSKLCTFFDPNHRDDWLFPTAPQKTIENQHWTNGDATKKLMKAW